MHGNLGKTGPPSRLIGSQQPLCQHRQGFPRSNPGQIGRSSHCHSPPIHRPITPGGLRRPPGSAVLHSSGAPPPASPRQLQTRRLRTTSPFRPLWWGRLACNGQQPRRLHHNALVDLFAHAPKSKRSWSRHGQALDNRWLVPDERALYDDMSAGRSSGSLTGKANPTHCPSPAAPSSKVFNGPGSWCACSWFRTERAKRLNG